MVRTDYVRLLDRLQPRPDGERPTRHRSGVVDALNADGTADVEISGLVIPDVSVLAGAPIGVGDVVQVLVWGGDMLILGRARDSDQDGPRGVLPDGHASVTSGQANISTTEVDLTGLSVTVDIPAGRLIQVEGFTLWATTVDLNIARVRIYQDAAQIAIGGAVTLDNSFVDSKVSTPPIELAAGSYTFKLTGQKATGGPGGFVSLTAGSNARPYILVEDVGAA